MEKQSQSGCALAQYDTKSRSLLSSIHSCDSIKCFFFKGKGKKREKTNKNNATKPYLNYTCRAPQSTSKSCSPCYFLHRAVDEGAAEGENTFQPAQPPLRRELWWNNRAPFIPADSRSGGWQGEKGSLTGAKPLGTKKKKKEKKRKEKLLHCIVKPYCAAAHCETILVKCSSSNCCGFLLILWSTYYATFYKRKWPDFLLSLHSCTIFLSLHDVKFGNGWSTGMLFTTY